ncbi:hypothetical protein [Rhodococcus sp. 14-2470-1a]|uniref:hypothetical protein n=1 Tax=Rhodococcus sp. 14-2470-1a TaxID=2023150 RepID=UPI00117ABFD1|nr:hypothetical protein [Rhodococcus sp. 14-2470-1a]
MASDLSPEAIIAPEVVMARHAISFRKVPVNLQIECDRHVACEGCGWVSSDCKNTDPRTEHALHQLERLRHNGHTVVPSGARKNAHVTQHGTTAEYEFGCRCAKCKNAIRVSVADRRERRRRERVNIDGRLVHPRAKHGQNSGYHNFGCRCQPCVDAHTAMKRQERARAAARKENG